ncbi:MAG TPA: hypothetical protein VLF15_12330 [Pseudoxanthomonas sp.]|nr:hypothetical protein [Pseudoxanthomonas sp.]
MTAVLGGCAFAAKAVTLPDAAQIQQAFQQAIALDLARAKANGDVIAVALLSSIRIEQVLGCVPTDDARMRCIVSMSGGMKQARHRTVRLQQHQHTWRVIPSDEDDSAPPSPTLAQAQQAMREHAVTALANGETAAGAQHAAIGLTVLDLDDCSLDEHRGHVGCRVDFRISAAAAPIASIIDFRLDGDDWRMEDAR